MPRHELEDLQLRRLQKLVRYVYDNVEIYRKKFDDLGIDPDSINSLQDIERLPFTEKDDMRAAYPYKMFAAPLKDIVRVHSSSGTTGQVSVVGYTQNDIDMWSECVARALVAYGLDENDVVHVAYGYGLFTGGLGLHYGSEKLGSITIPVSGGNTTRQVSILRDFGVSAIAATPSYALLVGEVAKDMGINFDELPVRVGIFGAEPWSESMRKQIEELYGIKAYDIYGLSEIMGPGVGFECECQSGLHINEDHFLIEIVDPETLEPVEDGEPGEVVFTTLTKEGIPLIRYRTRDISSLMTSECACGRSFKRLRRLSGRSDDMLIIRGVNVYPSQIEEILLRIDNVAPHYQIVLDKKGSMDTVEVQVELDPDTDIDEVRELQTITRKIKSEINSNLGISVDVSLVGAKTLVRSQGKIQRVIDNRNKEA